MEWEDFDQAGPVVKIREKEKRALEWPIDHSKAYWFISSQPYKAGKLACPSYFFPPSVESMAKKAKKEGIQMAGPATMKKTKKRKDVNPNAVTGSDELDRMRWSSSFPVDESMPLLIGSSEGGYSFFVVGVISLLNVFFSFQF